MTNKVDVGVIIGRFQVDKLHRGHLGVLAEASSRAKRLVVFLGVTSVKGGYSDPLDYHTRKEMIKAYNPDIDVYPIHDTRDDFTWSDNLDNKIREITPSKQTVTLFGSRDSFINHYFGVYPTEELESQSITSGTEVREELARSPENARLFRAGVIYGAHNRYPISYQTVDIVTWKEIEGEPYILLGRKPDEDKYRIPGGFVSPDDTSLESAAVRELTEECGDISVGGVSYVGSYRVDDWRYRAQEDKIMTTLFNAVYEYGRVYPGDDIAEVKWFSIRDLSHYDDRVRSVVPEHVDLVLAAIENKLDIQDYL